VRAAGHRIFRDALGRSEVAADKIVAFISRCGHNDPAAVQAGDRRDVWSQCAHHLRALQHSHVVEGVDQSFDRNGAQRFGQAGWCRHRLGRPDREIHDVSRLRPPDRQRPTRRVENHTVAARLQPFHDDRRTGQSGMAAQRHLGRRREPTQAIVSAVRYQKSRLRQIVLGSNGLHHRVRQETVQRHHRGGISCEATSGEGVKLEDRCAHGRGSTLLQNPGQRAGSAAGSGSQRLQRSPLKRLRQALRHTFSEPSARP